MEGIQRYVCRDILEKKFQQIYALKEVERNWSSIKL